MSKKDKAKKKPKKLARKPRGFPDRREGLIHAQAKLVETITAVYRQWGFESLETGAFEYVDALGKFLPDTDRPNEGVFALQDDDEQWMALRYDLTAPLARFVAEAGQNLGRPFRRYAAGPVWRNEKPGPGRFREFWQCDADTVGAPGYHADAEMIAMGAEALRAVGFDENEYVIRVNTRRLLNGVLGAVGAEDAELRLSILRALDKLDKFGPSGVADLLGDGRMDESGDFTKGAGLNADQIKAVLAFAEAGADTRVQTLANLERAAGNTEDGKAGLAELEAIATALEALGAPEKNVTIDPSVVRGLEYYTGPVYEAELLREVTDADGKTYRIGSIGGGGRYDDLVARFTAQKVPATGFSVGISRVAAALAIMDEVQTFDGPIVVLNLDRDNPGFALGVAAEIRSAGLRAEAYMGGANNMGKQLKYADRRASPAAVIIGSDEREKGVVTIKDLEVGAMEAKAIQSNEEYKAKRPGQVEVTKSDMISTLRNIVEAED